MMKMSRTSRLRLKASVVASIAAAVLLCPLAAHANGPDPLSIDDLEMLFRDSAMSDEDAAASVGVTSPFTPEQIRALRRHLDEVRRATAAPPAPHGEPIVSSRAISLEPGATPTQVRLESGTVTTIVFQDATGAPWPILRAPTGNDLINAEAPQGSNILTLSPRQEYVRTNIAVQLEGASAPVIMILEAGRQTKVDHRLDAVIQAHGPNARTLSLDLARGAAIAPHMISFQDGVPPQGAEALRVSGADGVRVWRYGDRLVVRTRMTLASPAALRSASSADGMRTYEITETPVVFLLSDGASHKITISL